MAKEVETNQIKYLIKNGNEPEGSVSRPPGWDQPSPFDSENKLNPVDDFHKTDKYKIKIDGNKYCKPATNV